MNIMYLTLFFWALIQQSTAFFYYKPSGYELLTSPRLQNKPLINGFGNGLPYGFGNGWPNGFGSRLPNGYGNGLPNGYGNGLPNGYGNGLTNGVGTGLTSGFRNRCRNRYGYGCRTRLPYGFRNGTTNSTNGVINEIQDDGICIDPGFVCKNPYDKSRTLQFECQDGMCPRGYKCCEQKCFQHKICMPVGPKPDVTPLANCGHWPQDCKKPYSYYTTYRFTCRNDNQCISGYKCCSHNCFLNRVCLRTQPYVKASNGTSRLKLVADPSVVDPLVRNPVVVDPVVVDSVVVDPVTVQPSVVDRLATELVEELKSSVIPEIPLTASTTENWTTKIDDPSTITSEEPESSVPTTDYYDLINVRMRPETPTKATEDKIENNYETVDQNEIEPEDNTEGKDTKEEEEYADYDYHYPSNDDGTEYDASENVV